MIDETKKLFNAPWQIWGDGCQVCDIRGTERVHCEDIKDSARSSRLPELYDALVEAMQYHCSSCVGFDVSDIPISNILKNCQRVDCCAHRWLKLLQKVRDGK